MSHSLFGDIPPGLYIVSYYHDDGMRAEVPACDLATARQRAKEIAESTGLMVDIDGIGPEKGFHEAMAIIPKPIGDLIFRRS